MDTDITKTGRPQINKPKAGSVHERIARANAANGGASAPAIQLLLDCSGSMGESEHGANKQNIELLREAVKIFISETDLSKYRIGMESFPQGRSQCPPTSVYHLLMLNADALSAGGGTPMGAAIAATLRLAPVPERAIIISDGQATDDPLAALSGSAGVTEETAMGAAGGTPQKALAKRTTPVFDCLHIGSSKDGEDTLKEIAKRTGGLFIKFTDLDAFRRNFKYLAPQYRGLLAAGKIDIGADEIK